MVWEEPRKFNPERFEGLEWEKHGLKLMPFGSGRRGCPGEVLVIRMLGLGLGSLIHEGTGLTLPRAHPLLVKCSTRPALVNLLSQI
ncbi:hypothetical protein VitviT2T_013608 [Vitis vinifera]|uniref:Uncharacterized protein n=1 Tax=Vitis vinifera TaxID=29760 RepID=A0ABY9CJQ7_VITVI|nr:hypothetical protein VitviT2T_013608 [Vitis vinifera]